MRSVIKNKKGALTDIFLFLIISFVIVFICGIFIYIGATMQDSLHDTMDNLTIGDGTTNVSNIIDDTFDDINLSLQSLYWIALFIIVAQILGIFIGAFLVTTRPVFFVPYIILMVIAVITAAAISNAYETIVATPELASTFTGFIGANAILLNLPMITAIVGFVGAIIMFISWKKSEDV